jgi:hypothetical protein
MKHFFKLLNVFGLEILVKLKYTELGNLCFEVEVAIGKLRRYE